MSDTTTRRLLCLPAALLLLALLPVATATAETVIVSLGGDPSRGAGTGPDGNLLVYSPDPVEPGSSISHWDISASPDLLMEPNISPFKVGGDLDVTVATLRALGWPTQGGAAIEIDYTDGAGEGFNDPTLGGQRRAAFERAVEIWAARLTSPVSVDVDVAFADLSCSETGGAVLAQAGPICVIEPDSVPGVWYAQALAEVIEGVSFTSCSANDLRVRFNENIDESCLGAGTGYYYGLDGNAPSGRISFLNTSTHELAHGLGFTSLVNEETGEKFQGQIDIYSSFLRDLDTGRRWTNMTPAQIRRSAVNARRVIFDSSEVRQAARPLLDIASFLRIDSPPSIADELAFGTAAFGPPLNGFDLTGEVELVDDGSASPTLGCNRLRNDLDGKIALVDRGSCLFVEKVKNAQNAGAIAVIVANNGDGLIDMGGDDPTITIPSVFVTQVTGQAIKDALADTGNGDDGDDDPLAPGVGVLVDAATTPCAVDENTLCLVAGRFEITATFTLGNGQTGSMGADQVTDDTGALYFNNPLNIEVFVKALDGCTINERWWIFAAGLTDQGIELRVRDTLAGKARTFSNPLGQVFDTFTGTVDSLGAFPTCP